MLNTLPCATGKVPHDGTFATRFATLGTSSEGCPRRLRKQRERRVSDGDRTRDNQDHNLVLYRLSYTHHSHTQERGVV